jgi:transposase-like protein
MAKKGRRATNEERLAAIQMYDNGLTADQIAEILDVGRSSVFDWVSKYRNGGLASISTKFASGRPTVWVPNWSSTSGDLGVFVDQSPEPIATSDARLGR